MAQFISTTLFALFTTIIIILVWALKFMPDVKRSILAELIHHYS